MYIDKTMHKTSTSLMHSGQGQGLRRITADQDIIYGIPMQCKVSRISAARAEAEVANEEV